MVVGQAIKVANGTQIFSKLNLFEAFQCNIVLLKCQVFSLDLYILAIVLFTLVTETCVATLISLSSQKWLSYRIRCYTIRQLIYYCGFLSNLFASSV